MSPEKERELRQAMHRVRTEFNRLPGPSDDPDEQTAVAAAYRHLLVTIQLLASEILSRPLRAQLAELSVDIATIYDVYDVIPRLHVLMIEIDGALRNLRDDSALTRNEIDRLVTQWIGVEGGYLGRPDSLRFSYPSHDEFWMNTCAVDADTRGFAGTTRQCFIDTLARVGPLQQAAALEAIVERFPVIDPADPELPNLRRPTFKIVLDGWIARVRGSTNAGRFTLTSAAAEVRAALDDADRLGPSRSVDRVHTAMHGYLHQLCIDSQITIESSDQTMARLLKALRQQHPSLVDGSARAGQTNKVLQGMAQILDVLNPIRNQHSAAHPRADLLDDADAELVSDTVRVLLRYLERRLGVRQGR